MWQIAFNQMAKKLFWYDTYQERNEMKYILGKI